MNRFYIPLIVLLAFSIQLKGQLFDITFPLLNTDCNTDWTVWRSANFCGDGGPVERYPIVFPDWRPGQPSDACVLPDNSGFSNLSAVYSNLDLIQTLMQNQHQAVCYVMQWEVTGGEFVDCWDIGLGKKIEFGDLTLAGFQSCSLFESEQEFPVASNDLGIASNVRIRWDSDNVDPSKKYGVKVKIKIENIQSRKIKIKKFGLDGGSLYHTGIPLMTL